MVAEWWYPVDFCFDLFSAIFNHFSTDLVLEKKNCPTLAWLEICAVRSKLGFCTVSLREKYDALGWHPRKDSSHVERVTWETIFYHVRLDLLTCCTIWSMITSHRVNKLKVFKPFWQIIGFNVVLSVTRVEHNTVNIFFFYRKWSSYGCWLW